MNVESKETFIVTGASSGIGAPAKSQERDALCDAVAHPHTARLPGDSRLNRAAAQESCSRRSARAGRPSHPLAIGACATRESSLNRRDRRRSFAPKRPLRPRKRRLDPGVPFVAGVFPIAAFSAEDARERVRNFDALYPLRALVCELRWNA